MPLNIETKPNQSNLPNWSIRCSLVTYPGHFFWRGGLTPLPGRLSAYSIPINGDTLIAYLSIYLSIYLSMPVCSYLSIYLSIYVCPYFFVRVYHIYLINNLSIHLPTHCNSVLFCFTYTPSLLGAHTYTHLCGVELIKIYTYNKIS